MGRIEQSIIEQESGVPPNGDTTNWDQPLIIAEPDVQAVTIDDNDQFLLLACDGLFDVFTPEEVVTFVRGSMEKHGDTQRCCQVRSVLILLPHPIIHSPSNSLTHLTRAFLCSI